MISFNYIKTSKQDRFSFLALTHGELGFETFPSTAHGESTPVRLLRSTALSFCQVDSK